MDDAAPAPNALLAPATEQDILHIFRLMLGRDTSDEHVQSFIAHKTTVQDVIGILLGSQEMFGLLLHRQDIPVLARPAAARDIRAIFEALLQREVTDEHLESLVEARSTALDVIRIIMLSAEFTTLVVEAAAAADHHARGPSLDLADLPLAADVPGGPGVVRVRVAATVVSAPSDPAVEPCLALLNAARDFNTTGATWRAADLRTLLRRGGTLLRLGLEDSAGAHGTAGVLVIEDGVIVQFAVAPEVLAKGLERTGVALAHQRIADGGAARVAALVQDTPQNTLCRTIYQSCGFTEVAPGRWEMEAGQTVPVPGHVGVEGPSFPSPGDQRHAS